MKDTLSKAISQAEKSNDKIGLSVLRLLNAVIVDRENRARQAGNFEELSDNEIYEIIVDFLKQREISSKKYDESGSKETADSERYEMKVIQSLLPKKLSDEEVTLAVNGMINEIRATNIRDKGRVMQALKGKYQRGEVDFSKAGQIILDRLTSNLQ